MLLEKDIWDTIKFFREKKRVVKINDHMKTFYHFQIHITRIHEAIVVSVVKYEH